MTADLPKKIELLTSDLASAEKFYIEDKSDGQYILNYAVCKHNLAEALLELKEEGVEKAVLLIFEALELLMSDLGDEKGTNYSSAIILCFKLIFYHMNETLRFKGRRKRIVGYLLKYTAELDRLASGNHLGSNSISLLEAIDIFNLAFENVWFQSIDIKTIDFWLEYFDKVYGYLSEIRSCVDGNDWRMVAGSLSLNHALMLSVTVESDSALGYLVSFAQSIKTKKTNSNFSNRYVQQIKNLTKAIGYLGDSFDSTCLFPVCFEMTKYFLTEESNGLYPMAPEDIQQVIHELTLLHCNLKEKFSEEENKIIFKITMKYYLAYIKSSVNKAVIEQPVISKLDDIALYLTSFDRFSSIGEFEVLLMQCISYLDVPFELTEIANEPVEDDVDLNFNHDEGFDSNSLPTGLEDGFRYHPVKDELMKVLIKYRCSSAC